MCRLTYLASCGRHQTGIPYIASEENCPCPKLKYITDEEELCDICRDEPGYVHGQEYLEWSTDLRDREIRKRHKANGGPMEGSWNIKTQANVEDGSESADGSWLGSDSASSGYGVDSIGSYQSDTTQNSSSSSDHGRKKKWSRNLHQESKIVPRNIRPVKIGDSKLCKLAAEVGDPLEEDDRVRWDVCVHGKPRKMSPDGEKYEILTEKKETRGRWKEFY